ncbi:MAG: ferredoxin family protein, partial [Mycobacteriales bacterium]
FYEVLPGRDAPLGSPGGSMKTGPIEADTPRTLELPPNTDAA